MRGIVWKCVESGGNVWKRVELCESDRNYVEICGNVWKCVE